MDRVTNFVNDTQLTAAISASDIATPSTASITVFNLIATVGGVTSNPLTFTIISPPAPSITTLSPNSTTAGGPAFTLTVTGMNFVSNSKVRWNGSDRPTAFVSSTQLTAMIPATDIAVAGMASIMVFNPGATSSCSSASNSLSLPVNNPIPMISNLNPNSAPACGQGFTLTVIGEKFVNGSVVRLNGANRPTTFISPTQLTVMLSTSDLANPGAASVTVFNPAPGGGTSSALPLNIVNSTPAIRTIFPNSIVAGSSGFTLTVTGSCFAPSSVVRWNGENRQTTFISSTQLTAQIPATDVQAVGNAMITVTNPAPGGGISNAAGFNITPRALPPPTLTSVAVSAVTQGARQMRLTLVGANFRPGARVIIGQSESNPALIQAADIIVESVNRLNDTTIQVIISVSPQARVTQRAVDVVNTDNTSTSVRGSNTTKPLQVRQGSSLGAPLQVTSLVIMHPRTGTVVAQGDQLFAEAILSGAGTGTVIGQWLWDGNVTEQFALNLTGGERQSLKTSNSLPTIFLGPHRLELKIIMPNLLISPAITVIVNPGAWKQMRLLAPIASRGFTPEHPPLLRWAIAPGVAKYQVGFSTQPFFRSITQWHDVTDTQWAVPAAVWSALPEGDIYWTVRAVEMSGATRRPALLRRIHRVASGALNPLPTANTQSSEIWLQWQGLRTTPIAATTTPITSLTAGAPQIIYRAAISQDAAGRLALRRFLTTKPQLELRSLQDRFNAGENYFWRVEAFAPNGRLILAGAWQSFTPRVASAPQETSQQLMNGPPTQTADAQEASQPASQRYSDLASLTPPPLDGNEGESKQNLAAQITARAPAPDQTSADARPLVSIEFQTNIATTDVSLLIDDTDVTATAQISGNKISFKPTIPLNNGAHQISLSVGGATVSWNFNVQAATAVSTETDAATSGSDAEAERAATADASSAGAAQADPNATDAATENQSQFNIETSSNTQAVSGSEAETNDLSLSVQGSYVNGPWRVETQGSGLMNSILGPKPRHMFGHFNDYVFRVVRETPESAWGADVSFGMIAPKMHQNAEFINTGSPREAIEAALKTPLGKFAFFLNTNDKGQGEGIGFGFHQQMQSASYETAAFKMFKDPERVKFKLMWLSARDVGGAPLKFGFDAEGNSGATTDAFATPRAGDSLGALLSVKLSQQWLWNSEYALTSNNLNYFLASSPRQFGRAWRTGFAGAWRKANISLSFRDVSPNFAIPATANLTQLGISDRRGLDYAISRDTRFGAFSGNYQLLQSDFRYAERAHLALHNINLNWAKTFAKNTVVSFGMNNARTITTNEDKPEITGQADQHRFGLNPSVTQTINTKTMGAISLSLTGSRNWFRDNVNQNANNIVSSLGVTGNWNPRPVFLLQSNFNVNWVAGEKFSVGGSRVTTLYLQPNITWPTRGWTITPLITINHMAGRLGSGVQTANMLMTQMGGRVSYQLPGRLSFNTLSFEGSQSRTRDRIQAITEVPTPRLAMLWTKVWSNQPK